MWSVEKKLEAQGCRPKRILRMQVRSSIPTTLLNSRASLRRYPSLDQWPVARDSQACIFYDSKHAASICLGTIQSRANVPLGLTSQRLLLQVQFKLRFTMQHISSHAQNLGNECSDHAAALGANQNIHTRRTHFSFDSTTLSAVCSNLDEALHVNSGPSAHRFFPCTACPAHLNATFTHAWLKTQGLSSVSVRPSQKGIVVPCHVISSTTF